MGASDEKPEPTLPTSSAPPKEPAKPALHPSVYVITWIACSSGVILFNKWILSDAGGFKFPLVLTTWHLVFATIMTQLMARFTTTLDSRKSVPMTGRIYLRAVVPIGFFFSLSLICGNMAYLTLSVSFIQMLKATNVVATLLTTWVMGLAPPNLKTLGNVSFIVLGVVIASVGEIKFVVTGFIFQVAGIIFESIRLVMVQRLLSSAEFKMDPLVSLYYFAPACAVINLVATLIVEVPRITLADFAHVGYFVLLANAMVAFALNISVVFLIGKTSAVVLTLCGVLKDILLVVASMIIFLDPVSPLQFFGYSIALSGLVYYRLGWDKIREHIAGGRRSWAEYGIKHPASRKLIVFFLFLTFIVVIVGLSWSYTPQQYRTTVIDNFDRVTGRPPKKAPVPWWHFWEQQ